MALDPNKAFVAGAALVGGLLGVGQFLGHEKIVQAAVMNPMLSGFGFGVAAVCGGLFVYMQWGEKIGALLSKRRKEVSSKDGPDTEEEPSIFASLLAFFGTGLFGSMILFAIAAFFIPLIFAGFGVIFEAAKDFWSWLGLLPRDD